MGDRFSIHILLHIHWAEKVFRSALWKCFNDKYDLLDAGREGAGLDGGKRRLEMKMGVLHA